MKSQIFILLFLTNFLALAKKSVLFQEAGSKDLAEYVEAYEDHNGELTIEDVVAIPDSFSTKNYKSYDHTESAIWYKISINNLQDKNTFLIVSPAWLPYLEFYQVNRGMVQNKKIGGTMAPFANRDLLSNKHGFQIPLGKKDYYFRVKSDHIISPQFIIGTEAQLIYYDRIEDHFHFFYFGLIFFLFCYNTFLSFSSKKSSYVYYTLCVLFLLISMTFIKGLINEFIDVPWFSNHNNIFTSLMVIFLMLSVAKFTKTEERFPLLNLLKKIIIYLAWLSFALNVFGFILWANALIINLVFVGGVWGLIVGFTILKERSLSSTLIFLGYASFIIGGIVHIFVLKGLLPHNLFTHNAYMIGSGIEVVFHSFAFGVNLNVLRRDKYQAQKELVKKAEENEKLVIEQNKVLEQKVTERTARLNEALEEIKTTLDTVHEQKAEIEYKNTHITDSIIYAKRIQDALLPTKELPQNYDLDLSIFYRPKDIISGDFYWFGEINNKLIIVVADCTGHGVPGAMLSISGHNLLNRIVLEEKNDNIAVILNQLHVDLTALMKCHETKTEDGMDVQIISYDKSSKALNFAGAKNPLYIINHDGELIKLKGNPFSIGGTQTSLNPIFDSHLIENWKSIFLCSDGYQDQFSEDDKKFMIGRLKNTFLEIEPLSTTAQEQQLTSTLENWQGEEEQTDDILVIGIKQSN